MPRFRHATLSTCHACLISGNYWDQRELWANHVLNIRSRVPRCLAKEAMMRVLMLPAAAAILLIGADLLCAPAAYAQVQSPSPGATAQPSNIPDQKLDAAAAAVQRVTTLRQKFFQCCYALAGQRLPASSNSASHPEPTDLRPALTGFMKSSMTAIA